MNPKDLKAFLRDHNLKPLKSLGQNFLIRSDLIEKIVKTVKQNPAPYVEIGPGPGALTRHFKKEEIFLIERDKKIAKYWKDKSWRVLCQDALKLKREQLPLSFTLFGNLPYEIASSFIIKTSIEGSRPETMIFLIQKEAAHRLKAKAQSKNYSLLSVMAQSFWNLSECFYVPKDCFYPKPKVDGILVELKAKNTLLDSPPAFLNFVKQCFHMKRKMLFKKLLIKEPKKHLENLGWSTNCRAEDLSPEDFIRLYESLQG